MNEYRKNIICVAFRHKKAKKHITADPKRAFMVRKTYCLLFKNFEVNKNDIFLTMKLNLFRNKSKELFICYFYNYIYIYIFYCQNYIDNYITNSSSLLERVQKYNIYE